MAQRHLSNGNFVPAQQDFSWSSALPAQLFLALTLAQAATGRYQGPRASPSWHIEHRLGSNWERTVLTWVTPWRKRVSQVSFYDPTTAWYNVTWSTLSSILRGGGFQRSWEEKLQSCALQSCAWGCAAVLCSGRQELFKCFDRTCRFLGNVFILLSVPILHRFPVQSRQTVWVCCNNMTSPRRDKKLHFQTIFTQFVTVFVLVTLLRCFQFYSESPFSSGHWRQAKRHQNTVVN